MAENSYTFELDSKSKIKINAKDITEAKEKLGKMTILELFRDYEIVNIKINKKD